MGRSQVQARQNESICSCLHDPLEKRAQFHHPEPNFAAELRGLAVTALLQTASTEHSLYCFELHGKGATIQNLLQWSDESTTKHFSRFWVPYQFCQVAVRLR